MTKKVWKRVIHFEEEWEGKFEGARMSEMVDKEVEWSK